MKYNSTEIIEILEDCDHLDDAIMYFTERSVPKKVPEGAIITVPSRYLNRRFEFIFENESWYGYGVDGQKIQETDIMQEILTEKYNGK